MGRWAQRRMRSSVGPGPTSPLLILSVVSADAEHVDVTFSAAVAATLGATADPFFTVASEPTTSIARVGPAVLRLAVPDGTSDLAWSLDGQPAWCLSSLVIPQDGVVV